MPKSAFDKTLEELGLPAGEYTSGEQACLNIIAKRVAQPLEARALSFWETHELSLKETELLASQLKQTPDISDETLKATCGVGVVVTREMLITALEPILSDESLEKFKALSSLSGKIPFADGAMLKAVVDEAYANRVIVKQPKTEPPPSRPAIPAGPTLEPLDVVYSIIPENNRYEQLTEPEKQHDEYLKSIGAQILTRFPPEPNGYLHIGHAKSMFINFGYAKMRGGKTYLRLDDTNPEAECEEYIECIKETVEWLGHKPFMITHASDHFQRLYDIAEDLIKSGHCYVDNETADEVADYREKRLDPPCRNRPALESLRLFREMRAGLHDPSTLTLRMRIDMENDNPNMRDPIAYRIKFCRHPASGDKWCIYPSYDFTHCLCDAFENITHSICTLEFNIRRPSYDWLTHVVEGWRPMEWEFSRMNLTHTVMSKRRLLRLVKEGYVSGWRDPRMPTLVGLRRRGFTADAINQFCELTGVSRNPQTIEYGLLEHVQREEFERECDRAMAVIDPVRVEIEGWQPKEVQYPLHPADASRGTEKIMLSHVIFIERSDFSAVNATEQFYGFAPDQPCALRYGPVLYFKELVKGKNGQFKVKATYSDDLEDAKRLIAEMRAKRKTLPRLHWISENDSRICEMRLYDVLFKSKDPMEIEDWLSDLNENSIRVLPHARIPKYVACACEDGKSYRHFEFEREGFFVVDEESTAKKPIMNLTVALKRDYE